MDVSSGSSNDTVLYGAGIKGKSFLMLIPERVFRPIAMQADADSL